MAQIIGSLPFTLETRMTFLSPYYGDGAALAILGRKNPQLRVLFLPLSLSLCLTANKQTMNEQNKFKYNPRTWV